MMMIILTGCPEVARLKEARLPSQAGRLPSDVCVYIYIYIYIYTYCCLCIVVECYMYVYIYIYIYGFLYSRVHLRHTPNLPTQIIPAKIA